MNPFINDNSSTTLVVKPDIFGTDNLENDLLFRVSWGNPFNSVSITSTSTQTVRDGLNAYLVRHEQDIGLLSSVIFWQKKTIDYQALHMALLLNSLSEDDFEKEAEKFVVHQKEVQPELIASVIGRLDSLTGLKFDTSDYADYFKCTQNNVMAGLGLLESPHFAAMLPSPVKK